MRHLNTPFYLFFLVLVVGACADYRVHYAGEAVGWEADVPEAGLKVSHTMYLIGDAGEMPAGEPPQVIDLLGRHLEAAGPNSSVVFLGDNLYKKGMPPKEEADARNAYIERLRTQLDILQTFKGQPFFVPGEHDWRQYGIEGLKRQRKFIEKYLGRSDIWFPDPGCGDPEEVELSDNLTLLLLDSQWWLTDWEGEPEINADCAVKSREVFRTYFEEAVKGNRAKNIVVAMHHPLFTNGPHGGEFTAREHLFPLTMLQKNLWLPLPLVGSLYPFYRSTVGSRQDAAHPDYRDLRDLLLGVLQKNGNFIVAAGHEHSLQYMERDDQAFIVSGSGSQRSATRLGNNADFTYGAPGFSQLDFYEDGSVWVRFWTVGEDDNGELVFRKQVKSALEHLMTDKEAAYTRYESGQDSIALPLGAYDFSKNGLGEWLWGKHYRDAYATTVSVPLLDLATFQGGVRPVQRGGGYQTNSLRLETTDERQFTMRSLDKDPTRMVGYPLNRSRIILDIIKDSFSGSHPLQALPLPALQDAVNLYHTNPQLFYVPAQPELGNFNGDYANALYLVEERPDDDVWTGHASFGYPEELLSTSDVIEELHEHHDHLVDDEWVVCARLFDLVVGDWDRHDDQWRWAMHEEGARSIYRPVPRDRDQATSHYDGLLFGLARQTVPAARPLRPFRPYQKRIWWSNFGSRFFDHTFLNGLEWEDWEREARYIQQNLSDEIIQRAYRAAWPGSIYELNGAAIVETIAARRDTLIDLARQLYEQRARKVDVVGTNERDLFEVRRLNDDETRIRVYDTNKEQDKEALLYERTFYRSESEEVRLYGLQDEDVFDIGGQVRKGITLRIIGGLGNDVFVDSSRVSGPGKKTIIHDVLSEDNEVRAGPETRVRISADPKYNLYNRLGNDYGMDYWVFLPTVGFNPDDGLLVGASAEFTHYGFRKLPYAGNHFLAAKYALATSGVELFYRSEFIDVFGGWGLRFDGLYRSPLYAANFYGFGNETKNEEAELGDDYYRVRQREIRIAPSLMKINNRASRFYFGPTYEAIRVERTEGRYIDYLASLEDSPIDPDFFEGQQFLGLRAVFDFENLDDPAFPSRGLKAYLDAGWRWQLEEGKKHFPYLEGYVAGYQPLDARQRLVIGTRIGARHLFSDDFEFYQGARLGGTGPRANFRGFRRDRFTGRTAFYQNIDLRYLAISSDNPILPFSMGFLSGFDHGRVWMPGEASDQWHYSYGGGVFVAPLDLLSAQLSAFRGNDEQWRFVFIGTFFF